MRRSAFATAIVAVLVLLGGLTAGFVSASDQAPGNRPQEAVVTQTSVGDLVALISLYNATDGANWSNNTNWLSETPAGEWYGITTDGSGRVVELDLYQNELSGTIPKALDRLTSLGSLNLGFNQLKGEIPSELANLTNLQTLQLSGNELSGEIPSELARLSNLTHLALDGNQLTGEIPSELGNLSNLTQLFLDQCELSGKIPPALGTLHRLHTLHLENNQLSGEMPSELKGLRSVHRLDLSFNQLSGKIPLELGELSNLTHLQLDENQLSGEIPSVLGILTNLHTLSLSSNQLNGKIPSELGGLSDLGFLSLHTNQLKGEIPSTLGDLARLRHLWLNENQLSGKIPTGLGNLSNLTSLNLRRNQLSGVIPADLGDMTNLTTLYLGDNQLTGAIPGKLGSLTNLTVLHLRNNQLAGAIPKELGNLTNLTSLSLRGNQLSGSIPGELESLTNLTVLLLNGNQLTGCIPIDLADTERHDLYEIGLPFCGALEVPVIVTPIKAGVSTLTVSWVPPTDTGDQIITGYSLRYIRADADDTVEGNWTIVGYARNYSRLLRHVITGLAPATEYKVQVGAVRTTGVSRSTAATVTTEWGAVRSFQSVFVDPGSNVEVTIAVGGYGAVGEVIETLPDGFSYQSSNLPETSVKVTGREVSFSLSEVETFTYTVTASSSEGPYGLHGWTINSATTRREVIGDAVLVVSNEPRVSATSSTETQVRLDSPIPVTVTFSEPVSGFTIDDIDLANGVVSNFAGSGAVYTFDVTPNAIGEVTVDISAGAARDADGYGNMAAPTLGLGIPYDDDGNGRITKEAAIAVIILYFSG